MIELLAADRQSVIITAFWMLVGAGVVGSIGAWILLRREVRSQRATATDTGDGDGDGDGDGESSEAVEETAGT